MIDKNTEDWFQHHKDEFVDPNQLEFDFPKVESNHYEFTMNKGKSNELTFRVDPNKKIKLKWKYIADFRIRLIEEARNSRIAHEILMDFDNLLDCAERD